MSVSAQSVSAAPSSVAVSVGRGDRHLDLANDVAGIDAEIDPVHRDTELGFAIDQRPGQRIAATIERQCAGVTIERARDGTARMASRRIWS